MVLIQNHAILLVLVWAVIQVPLGTLAGRAIKFGMS
jgi:hypothetical protein